MCYPSQPTFILTAKLKFEWPGTMKFNASEMIINILQVFA